MQNHLRLFQYAFPKQDSKQSFQAVDSGFVYEVTLNEKAKWDDGTLIKADDYIESMELLLNSKMRNYRANTYYSGTSALANAKKYYDSEAPLPDRACSKRGSLRM